MHAPRCRGAIASGFDRGPQPGLLLVSARSRPRRGLVGGPSPSGTATPATAGTIQQGRRGSRGQKGPYLLLVPEVHDRRPPRVGDARPPPPDGDDTLGGSSSTTSGPATSTPARAASSTADGLAGRGRLLLWNPATQGPRFLDDLSLVSSAGIWDSRFAAFLYLNTCVVAGLRSARLAKAIGREESSFAWSDLADRIWHEGILREPVEDRRGPGWSTLMEAGSSTPAGSRSPRRLDRPARIPARTFGALDVSLLGSGRAVRLTSRRRPDSRHRSSSGVGFPLREGVRESPCPAPEAPPLRPDRAGSRRGPRPPRGRPP